MEGPVALPEPIPELVADDPSPSMQHCSDISTDSGTSILNTVMLVLRRGGVWLVVGVKLGPLVFGWFVCG